MFEYRVRWQRTGMKPKSRIYATKKGAERLLVLLGPEPWKAWGAQPDDLFCCNGYMCSCGGLTTREQSDRERKDMPAIEWLKLERRKAGAWAADEERGA